MNLHLWRPAALLLCGAAGLWTSVGVAAHEGEDHGDSPHPPDTAAAPAGAPRATAQSPVFELVILLDSAAPANGAAGPTLRLLLDHFATNEPVRGAQVEVDGAGPAVPARESSPGVYLARLGTPGPLAAGTKLPLTISVEAGDSADLLSTTLVIPSPTADAMAPGPLAAGRLGRLAAAGSALWPAAATAAAVAGLAGLALALLRRRRRRPGVQ